MFSRGDVIQERLAEMFGDDMRKFLREHRVCVADVAERIGMNKHTLQGYATGTACPPLNVAVRINRVVPLPLTLNLFGEMLAEREIESATTEEIMHGLATVGEVAAKASAAVLEALADGHLTPAERDVCRKKFAAQAAEAQRMIEMLDNPAPKATKRPASMADAEAQAKRNAT